MSKIKITPLGGLGETGALNCMLYQTEDSAIVVDCGVRFVDDRHPGVGLIIPNFDFLEDYRDKLKAIVLTHGHEDHIGALPYLLKRFPLPIYATQFTKGVLQAKLAEFELEKSEIWDLDYDQVVRIDDFEIDPVFVNHSMMDVAALLIATDHTKVFHCTDFKIDQSAPDGAIDLAKIRQIGDDGLDLLLLDSTNALSAGWTTSETKVRDNLLDRFIKIKGRIITCLFSSNSYRLQSLVECARITGRKIALTGRSTKEYSRVASEIDRLDFTGVQRYDVEDIGDFPDSEILVVVTGSQAEPRSVLSRMSQGMFGPFKIRHGDTLLMSSKMIPGNEGRILEMLNRLSLLGANVITESFDNPIHASGHAKQDELREIMRLTKPKYFLPIHGSYRHLKKHAEIAIEEGVQEENSIVILDGETIELNSEGLFCIDQVEIGQKYVSENCRDFISFEAVKRRRKMAWNGLVAVSVEYDIAEGRVRLPLVIRSEGLFGGSIEADAIKDLTDCLEKLLTKDPKIGVEKLQKFFKVEVRRFYKNKFEIRPEVMVLVHEV